MRLDPAARLKKQILASRFVGSVGNPWEGREALPFSQTLGRMGRTKRAKCLGSY